MKLSSLHRLLNHEMEPSALVAEISDEVALCIKNLAKGASGDIYVTQDVSFIFNYAHRDYLMALRDEGVIDEPTITYIFDAVTLAENVRCIDDDLFDELAVYDTK